MRGTFGLYLDSERLQLGRLTAVMLHEMAARGPSSAGFAI